MHEIQFYQAFPRVSTASDKHWGEKARVRYANEHSTCENFGNCDCDNRHTLFINAQLYMTAWVNTMKGYVLLCTSFRASIKVHPREIFFGRMKDPLPGVLKYETGKQRQWRICHIRGGKDR